MQALQPVTGYTYGDVSVWTSHVAGYRQHEITVERWMAT